MNKPDAKILDDIRTQFPDRKAVTLHHTIDFGSEAGGEETIFAVALVPNRTEWTRLRKEMVDEDKRAMAGEQLVRRCVKWPAPEEFSAILERLPGIASTLFGSLSRLAGVATEAELGK